MGRTLSRLRRLALRFSRALQSERRAWVTRGPIRAGSVLYESFAGNGALCNPEAIFRELLRNPDPTVREHIWVLDRMRSHPGIRREFARDATVRFVRRGSAKYFRALGTSQYLINNATFPPEFSKRAGQTYLNTWHGTPLKRMGYDMPDGASESANTLRNLLSADFLLSQNEYMTTTMYHDAYRLRGAFRGLVIEAGYPRVDRQHSDNDTTATRQMLIDSGIPILDRRVVLYAPTWRGEAFTRPEDDLGEVLETARALQDALGDQHLVIVKAHQSVYEFARAGGHSTRVLVPNDIPTNALLAVTDTLITDYSSIFFDFLTTGRPIAFLVPDGDDYVDGRGTYLGSDSLPGPVFSRVDELAEFVSSPIDEAWRARRHEWATRFTPQSDGRAAARVIDVVFHDARDGYRLVSLADDPRESLLIHLGGMRSNGITSSALNLLRHLDYDRYRVSVIFTRPSSRQQWENQSRIDSRVTQFHRSGGVNGSKFIHLLRRLAVWRADGAYHLTSRQRSMWWGEWNRCLGDSSFDAVIDFSGYTPFWATLLLHSPGGRRSIWMHNDMQAETRRIIRGRPRMLRNLRAVFSLYDQYDALVSVSAPLRDVNLASLGESYGLSAAAFFAATNVVNERRVIRGARVPILDVPDYPVDPDTLERIIPDWARDLSEHNGLVWFCTVGRFSTEKNQARMIRAFAEVHRRHPETRLLLVGYGPLRASLESLVSRMGLTGSVFLGGPFANPFPFVAAADCFLLSSSYEGQPMVLLEAAIVGIPIVTVEFASVSGALPEGSMLIVDQSDAALASGMLAFLRGEVPSAQLDAVLYNAAALREFTTAVSDTARISQ